MPQIELLTVANHAEAINGLLYLSGAGWTDLHRAIQPGAPIPVNHIGIGVAILIAWDETNQRHRIGVRIENADGQTLINVQGDMELGRPAGVLQGADLRGVMAMNGEVQFPSAGVYRVVASVGDDVRSVTFRVNDNTAPAAATSGMLPRG